MDSEATIQDLMDSLPAFFLADKAAGIRAVVQFALSGEDGGEWTVRIAEQSCQVTKGKVESADLLFQASARDVLDIFYDRLEPMSAYMQGKLRLSGNFGLALKLFGLFEVDSEEMRRLRNK